MLTVLLDLVNKNSSKLKLQQNSHATLSNTQLYFIAELFMFLNELFDL